MLSDRRQKILRALIEEYVAHALPVGSKTIAEHYRIGVSSATIRNELSALEVDGYIEQPHTSSGRVPTDAGYRVFVDELINAGETTGQAFEDPMIERIRKSADALDDLIERTTEEMARLTDCLSIVSAPTLLMTAIRQVSLISLSNHQALLVIVFHDGQVVNRHLSFDEEVSAERLAQAQEAISALIVDSTVSQSIERIGEASKKAVSDPLFAKILEALSSELSAMDPIALSRREGLSSLMRMPEFQSSSSLLPLMEILEDNSVLFKMLDPAYGEEEVSVRIGAENALDELSGVSVITASYGRGDGRGVVAVIGPKRMNYTQVIQAVRGAQSILGE